MAAISVGSVEVDVVPNARNIRQRLQQQVVPAADSVGDEVGRVLGRYITRHIGQAVVQGIMQGGRQAQAPAARQGTQTGSAFARGFKGRLEAALRDLPEVRLHANSSDADREIAQIRTQLQALRDARIGIDVDAGTATAAMARLQERLERLSASSANVQVRIDTAAAAAQLAAMQAQVNSLDGQTADVDVDADTRPAIQGFSALTTAALAFGPAILPVLPVVAAGLGAIAAAGVAAAAGIGGIALVAVPAFKQIGTVLQAQKAAQDAAAQSTAAGGQAAAQAASRSLQLASAQQAVASAERNGARQVAQAQAQVTQARRAAAQVAAQASQRAQQAARAVEDAEDALSDAQKAAARAQRDLTDARRTAAQELQDLNNRLTDSVLSQRDAELSLTEATRERDAVLSSATSTELDKQRAILAYDQAVQRLKEQTTETARLKKETAAANKAGVEGSKTVRTAQEQLAAAQEAVADKAQALRDAQADQARQQIESAQAIADAQQRIVDAQANVGVAQEQAAEQAASAARQLQQAQLSAAGGTDAAAQAQAKYRQELAKLTPAARTTMTAYTNLRGAFSAWSRSLQPQVMPIFTRALDGMRRALPGLTPLVTGAADAISGLQDRASQGFKSPWWKTFKKDLDTSVKPAITGLGVAFGNIFKGIIGVIGAFLPHMNGISGGLQDVTKRFADWGTSLRGSDRFERFLSYAAEMGPRVWKTFKDVAGAALDIATALAPVGAVVMRVIQGVAQGFSWVAEKAPWLVRAVWGVIVVWGVLNAVMGLSPFTLIVIGVGLVVAALVYAYNRFGWFRTAVQAIGDVFVWLWKSIIKPYVEFMIGYWKMVGQVAMWLWQEAIRPAVNFIIGAFKLWWSAVKLYFKGIELAFKTLAAGFSAIWTGIKDGFKNSWDWLKKWVLNPIGTFFTKTIPGWATTLKDKTVEAFNLAKTGIKTAWDQIQDITKKPVEFVVNTVYNDGIRKVWNLVTDAFGGKKLDPMKFASGGIMPGYTPGRDVHLVPSAAGPVALSGGEAIMRPEWTRAVGAGYVTAMNAAARSGGVGGVQAALGFKDGGIFSGIGSALSGAWDSVKKGASWLKESFGSAIQAGVKSVVNPLIDKIPGGSIGFVGLLKSLMKSAVTRLVGAGKKGDEQITPRVSYTPSAGVEQWRPVVLQALKEVGQSAGLADTTLRRMQQESGGNPTIVNKWDSNWIAGHPSVGLMQVIGPTFRSYAGKYLRRGPFSYGVSVDPLANIYSSMRYALGAYGSLSKAYNRAGGYDSGGYLQPGLNLAFNGTGRPEPVFTTRQANALTSMAARGSSGPAGLQPGDQLQLVVDGQEFSAYVDVRANNRLDATLRPMAAQIAGRRG
ncbi:hypothetical protein ACH4F6_08815 [Streptomyces sp. NPDC017936]|uniref:hypothetical protein n=1 Tax=Streptomyces sp. NPDC017936 TaxID=3365016 RepID=UPI0037ABD34C